jgi:hypothetical protein
VRSGYCPPLFSNRIVTLRGLSRGRISVSDCSESASDVATARTIYDRENSIQNDTDHRSDWRCNVCIHPEQRVLSERGWGRETGEGENGLCLCLSGDKVVFLHDRSQSQRALRLRYRWRATHEGSGARQRLGQGESRSARELATKRNGLPLLPRTISNSAATPWLRTDTCCPIFSQTRILKKIKLPRISVYGSVDYGRLRGWIRLSA